MQSTPAMQATTTWTVVNHSIMPGTFGDLVAGKFTRVLASLPWNSISPTRWPVGAIAATGSPPPSRSGTWMRLP